MTVRLNFPRTTEIRTLIRWDNKIAIADGFSGFARGGTFCNFTPYIVRNGAWIGTWSSNSNAYPLSSAEMAYIKGLQDPTNLKPVWGWLTAGSETNKWMAPMLEFPDGTGRIIAAVYAGNQVEVLEHRDILLSFNGVGALMPMVRIRTGMSVIHNVTTCDNDNQFFYSTPVGPVRLPVYGAGDEWWLMWRWLL